MSDKVEELKSCYRKNVFREKARNVGLFTIPEYPEYQRKPGMWATALDVILTTLRYLAPATLLTIFWGHQSFLFKLLKYVDSAFRSIVYSSEEQKQSVLQWLEHAGTVRVDKLETVWRHGWLICGVLDRALPGACSGHPPTKLSLKHAQSIAENYLGIEPIFTNQELESIETLGKHQEWKLITFLDNIRLSLAKLAPPSPKTSTTRIESVHHTFDYIAKGSGLAAAQINNKANFKIYPTAHQSSDPGEINIEINGPKNAHGTLTIPAILGKAQMLRQSLFGKRSTTNYTESILPITQGATYLRTYGKNDMSKTYFMPPTKCNIEIESEVNEDHVNIGYTVEFEGKYQISITSKNLSIAGSPFSMAASKNIVEILEKDSFCLEDGEEIDIVDVTTDRKAILRIVDFGTEKMLLKENGSLEKISEEEAKHLMESDTVKDSENIIKQTEDNLSKDRVKDDESFKTSIAENEYTMCEPIQQEYNIDNIIRHQSDIPDVVNSTFNVKADSVTNKRDMYIVPENISVSLKTEKHNTQKTTNISETSDKYENLNLALIKGKLFDEESLTEDSLNSSNNQYINDTYCESLSTEKKFGSFIKSEYETNNSQNEEMQNASTKEILTNNFELNKHCHVSGTCKSDPATHSNKTNTKISNIKNKSFKSSDKPHVFNDNYKNNNNLNNQMHFTDFKIGAPVSIVPETCSQKNITEAVTHNKHALTDNETTDLSVNPNVSKTSEYKELNQENICTKLPNKDMWDSAYVSIDETNSCDVFLNEGVHDYNNKQKHFNVDVIPNELSDSQHTEKLNGMPKHKQQPETLPFKPIQEEILQKEKVSQKGNYSQEDDSVTEALAHLDDIYDDYFLNKDFEQTTNQNKEKINHVIKHTIECDVHVDSASEYTSDVKRHIIKTEGKISGVQAMVTESDSASQILNTTDKENNENTNNKAFDEIQFGDKTYSNIVTRRKVYWDEKIRQIESKAEEFKSFSKRRLSSKYLRRNDSLTKRRGKQIAQNYLNSNKIEQTYDNQTSQYNKCDNLVNRPAAEIHNKIKLKDSFKNCWDNRVNAINTIDSCFGKKNTKNKGTSISCENFSSNNKNVTNKYENCNLNTTLQMKQELSEKVFEAFETSPKRFFGTSRQQILNKIDTFMERSDEDDVHDKNDINNISHDSGLVSSRISLFHSISKTEPLSTSHRKHKSLHNISNEKVSIDKNFILKEHPKSFNDGSETNCIKIGNKFNIDQNANLIKEPLVSFQVEKLEVCKVPENEYVDVCKKKITDSNIDTSFNPSIQNRTESLENLTEFDKHLLTKTNLKNLSKSEMDIFSKTSTVLDIDIDKHKSYEELPKISVKKFISIYEDVSKSAIGIKPMEYDTRHKRFQNHIQSESSTGGTSKGIKIETLKPMDTADNKKHEEIDESLQIEFLNSIDKHESCLSLSDMEIEIIDKADSTTEHETETKEYINYKNRFIMAKQYFKSLEDVRIESKPKRNKENLNLNDTNESLDNNNNRKQKRNNVKKSRSMPSSEISKIWNEMQNQQSGTDNTKKLMKISEKFNVEDLYEDVMDGRLSRQGSLRGIPNKKAVLETFRSMDNVNGIKFNSYEFAKLQTSEFKIENEIRKAQTYLSEYPYLPTTDPSKYHSRFDASACGLITFKELKQMKNVRRNSVPESMINSFITYKH